MYVVIDKLDSLFSTSLDRQLDIMKVVSAELPRPIGLSYRTYKLKTIEI